ncbi:NACHT domain-containing protein [Azospirillum sp. B4]|uniref:NACHT domain-containing protein n=1 Tax=Azospirillum sp. B4 TaxID=95605 RepID=UPI00034B7A9E|nr:NACHT domain-containing protein [Azospirillum sp. B4]
MLHLNASLLPPYFPARLGTPVQRGQLDGEEGGSRLPRYEAWREGFDHGILAERPEAAVLDELLRVGDGLTLILGEPGAGKSRLLEHWAGRTRPAAPGYGVLVPLLLPLRHLKGQSSLVDPALRGPALADALWALGEPGADVPTNGRCFRPLWLLDGLDELPADPPLRDWLKRLPSLPGVMVATCRTAVWQAAELGSAPRPRQIETIMPLRPGRERIDFLRPALGPNAETLAAQLDAQPALSPLAGNPMLLQLAALLWAEDPGRLPASRDQFYRRAVAALWHRRVLPEARDRTRERDRVLVRLADRMGPGAEVEKGCWRTAWTIPVPPKS